MRRLKESLKKLDKSRQKYEILFIFGLAIFTPLFWLGAFFVPSDISSLTKKLILGVPFTLLLLSFCWGLPIYIRQWVKKQKDNE